MLLEDCPHRKSFYEGDVFRGKIIFKISQVQNITSKQY